MPKEVTLSWDEWKELQEMRSRYAALEARNGFDLYEIRKILAPTLNYGTDRKKMRYAVKKVVDGIRGSDV